MAIYTKAELATYLGKAPTDISDDEYNLRLELVTTEIIIVTGQARFDAAGEAVFKPVALEMAKALSVNPDGIRTEQESIDDYNRSMTYASETVAAAMTADQERRIRRAAGMRGAFSIVLADRP